MKGDTMIVTLSASTIAKADNCRYQLFLDKVEKIKVAVRSANLAFGSCIDQAVREYLNATALGERLPDPERRFEELWEQARQKEELSYASTVTPEAFTKIGTELMKQFPEAWGKTGYRVALDADGNPLLDLKLEVDLGNGVYLRGVIDLVVYTSDDRLVVIDVKTSSTPHTELYTMRSDQLTSYQTMMVTHAKRLGVPSPQALGFLDLLKYKASPRIESPVVVPLRTQTEIRTFIQKCYWIADDMRRGRYPKTSRVAFNTPCTSMCDYAQYCVYGDTEGLIFPEHTSNLATA